jgi:hypothetical protein
MGLTVFSRLSSTCIGLYEVDLVLGAVNAAEATDAERARGWAE